MKMFIFVRLCLLAVGLVFLFTACNNEEPAEEPAPTATAVAEAVETATTNPTPTNTATAVPTDEPTAVPIIPPTFTPEPTTIPSTTAFVEARCEFDVPHGRDVTCGWLTVPEDRSDPANENTIRLHVAIFASDNPNPAPDPIVYLEGGPGGDALEVVPLIFELRFAPYLANHALIMFDQRGTGYSEPSLACPEYTDLSYELIEQDISPEEAGQQSIETLLACRDRLADEGVNLAAYNSAASAADLHDLRLALGYEEWNVWGVSYGTRLAQTLMRDYPAGIRSVILDSAYPLEVNLLTDTPENVARAFTVFFAGCAADPACAEAYPDLETLFYDTVAQLNEEKITLSITNVFTGDSYDASFRGDELVGVLFQSLYATEIIPELPKLIADVNAGEVNTLSLLLSSFLSNSDFVSAGMQFSVQCYEENGFATAEELTAALAAQPELEPVFRDSPNLGPNALVICEQWGAGTAVALENEPVTSDIPTLILAGEYDPITPPAWGEQVQANLSTAYFYEFPGTGHGVSLSGACGISIIQSFLAEPTAVPDTTCLAELSGPAFVTSGGEIAEVVMTPYTDEMFGFSSVKPAGWTEAGPGVFARGSTGLDQTVLIQQAAPGTTADFLIGLLTSQLGLTAAPTGDELLEAGGHTWTLYETETQGLPVLLATAEAGSTTLLVVLITNPNEKEALYEMVMLPALEAFQITP
ncbi:MAG TPA: alpha/beta fold hydrolase [Chloroflexota bacterium]|nr:alpha/beta fold hydrolase [Chloroflexota bacterium]